MILKSRRNVRGDDNQWNCLSIGLALHDVFDVIVILFLLVGKAMRSQFEFVSLRSRQN